MARKNVFCLRCCQLFTISHLVLSCRLSTNPSWQLILNQSRAKVKVMLRPTVSRSVCLGVKPHLELKLSQTVAGLLMWGAQFDERTGPSFTIAAGPHQRSHSWFRVPRDYNNILLSQIRDSPPPNLEGQVSVFIPRRNRLAQLYSQTLGSNC
jgi:hypothetical protein